MLERAIITTPDSVLRLSEVLGSQTETRTETADAAANLSAMADVERRHILTVLKATNWRISGPNGAAKILGLNPSTLRFRIKKLGIQKNE